jgi:hypothetical protein
VVATGVLSSIAHVGQRAKVKGKVKGLGLGLGLGLGVGVSLSERISERLSVSAATVSFLLVDE